MSKLKALIIGNGPSVLEHQIGDRIDSNEFDIICRINRGHKQDNGDLNTEYVKYVGSKCDIWFCHDFRLKLAMQRSSEYDQIFVFYPSFKYNPNIQDTVNKTCNNVHIVDPLIEGEINQLFNFSPRWPTTGIVAIHQMHHYPDLEIYIHGFDSYDEKYDNSHFFENKPNKYKNSSQSDHSPSLEKDYITYMINEGKIKKII